MQNKLAAAILLSVLGLVPDVLAQQQPNPEPQPEAACPEVQVTAPDYVVAGEQITVTVSLSGGDPSVTPTYNWTVSDGSIDEGQGESTIRINTEGVVSGYITATVDVGGYDRECSTSASATTTVESKPAEEAPAEEPPAEDENPPR